MKQPFKENSFTVSTTHHAHGLFIVLSRFNHSCIPNCKIPMADNVIQKNDLQIYAIKTIMPGEELTFCYNPMYEYRTAKERAQQLGFQCDCKACLIGTPFQQVSDMRRVLMRGLYYIRRGEDIDGPTPGPGCTFRIDPEVKRAVEELTLPMSTRFC
ncbi:hypothetical protein F5883DRAFT_533723 [Diaporthe sp. PMI_573]|nr:hypothetical protein F5883DRAFT_533723 [Diaporthaceae sp. PMI_573]